MSHRYWRILISSENGDANTVSISSIYMFDSSGSSLCSGGTASASSVYSGSSTYNADKAFDNDDTTFWNAANTPTSGSPEWIEYDFGSAVDVAAFLVRPRMSLYGQGPQNFKLQYSDNNSTWTDAAGPFNPDWLYGQSPSGSNRTVAYTFPVGTPSAGNYTNWRCSLTSWASGNPNAAEVEMRTIAGGSQAATGGRAWSINYAFGDPAANAFDGNTSTVWASNFSSSPDYLGYSFTKALAIVEVQWTAPTTGGTAGQNPDVIDIQGSNDGLNWTTIYSGYVVPSPWTTGATQIFGPPSSSTQPQVFVIT